MNICHPQENIVKTYDYNGIAVDLVEWSASVWCGKIGYTYGNDTLPIVEYYGFFKPEDGTHEYCYLYVPVQENNVIEK